MCRLGSDLWFERKLWFMVFVPQNSKAILRHANCFLTHDFLKASGACTQPPQSKTGLLVFDLPAASNNKWKLSNTFSYERISSSPPTKVHFILALKLKVFGWTKGISSSSTERSDKAKTLLATKTWETSWIGRREMEGMKAEKIRNEDDKTSPREMRLSKCLHRAK